MAWNSTTNYYIQPGRKGSLYTLRKSWSAYCNVLRQERSGDEFICNLYTADTNAALDRAASEHGIDRSQIAVYGGASGEREDLSKLMSFGKHEGERIDSVPVSYLEWAVTNCPAKFTKAQMSIIEAREDYQEILEKGRKAQDARDAQLQARLKKEQEWKAKKLQSQYVGEIGDKMEFTVKVVHTATISTKYGISVLLIMKDEKGNTIKSFGTSVAHDEMEKGNTYTIKGTVKKHEEYNGEKGTSIIRIKII